MQYCYFLGTNDLTVVLYDVSAIARSMAKYARISDFVMALEVAALKGFLLLGILCETS